MRVISGSARGTRLQSFKGAKIRPTLDRVKESYFNRVGPGLSDLWFLDLFAGSGNMGVEALSRDAAQTVFVEKDARAQEVILRNLEKCHFGSEGDEGANWVLLKMEAVQAIQVLEGRGQRFDLVYVDPPFTQELYADCLIELAGSKILQPEALVTVERHHKNNLEPNYGRLSLLNERRMGDTCLGFYGLGEGDG